MLSYGSPMIILWSPVGFCWFALGPGIALCGIGFGFRTVCHSISGLFVPGLGRCPFASGSWWLEDDSYLVKLWSTGSVIFINLIWFDKGASTMENELTSRHRVLFPCLPSAYRILAPTPLMCRSRMPQKR